MDNASTVSKKFLVMEGNQLRGFTRSVAFGWYLSGVGASPMPVMVVRDGEMVPAKAELRSGRWRIAGKDGAPLMDEEAQNRGRSGLVWAATLDEHVRSAGFRVELGKGPVFTLERNAMTVTFNPEAFVERSTPELAEEAMWIIQDCATAMHPRLLGPTTVEQFIASRIDSEDEVESQCYQDFKDTFMEE